jgi:hypothetical protein
MNKARIIADCLSLNLQLHRICHTGIAIPISPDKQMTAAKTALHIAAQPFTSSGIARRLITGS